ncbi:hypothetical protein ACWDN6_35825, partial [Streptomyces albogriseolus]
TLKADDDHAMGWLATLTRHAVRDFYKPRRNREQPRDWSDTVSSFALPTAPAAEDVALAELMPELPEHLAALVDSLSETEQAVVRLRCEGLTHRAIIAHTGNSNVFRRLRSAFDTLRPALLADQPAKPPLPVRKPGATNPPKPRATYSRASVALAG